MSPREKRCWVLAGLWLLLIYSTLYLVRGPIEYLRDRNLLRLSVALVFVAAGAWILSVLIKRRPGRREWTVYGGAAALYLAGLWWLEQPEERLHLVEYGLLGGLFYSAFVERHKNSGKDLSQRRAAVAPALALTLVAGWVDEGIQHLLPNRYYDLRDVLLNLLAGALAVVAMHLAAAARRHDRPD